MNEATEAPADLDIVGHRIQALLKFGKGMILTLRQPARRLPLSEIPGSVLNDGRTEMYEELAPLHVAFFPALVVNLPPGTKPSPETLQKTSKHPALGMMVRTHEGPLPEAIQALAEDLMPADQFAVLRDRAITSVATASDGNGLDIEIEGGAYVLHIDLTGAIVLQRETPEDRRN